MMRAFSLSLLSFVLIGCSSLPTNIQKPEAKVTKVKLTEPTLTDAILRFTLNVSNPNSFALNLDKIDYTLHLNDQEFLKGSLDQALEIAANGDSVVEIPLSLRYEDIFMGAKAFAKSSSPRYRFEGKVHSGIWSIPITKEGEVRLPDASSLLR